MKFSDNEFESLIPLAKTMRNRYTIFNQIDTSNMKCEQILTGGVKSS